MSLPSRRYSTPSNGLYARPHALANVKSTDTVIVGNGPAGLFLSFLLHGNVPIYDTTLNGPHPDPLLHAKLSQFSGKPLYAALSSQKACEHLTEHFSASSKMSYSDQALPINVLLDTLLRPNADTESGEIKSRIRWEKDLTKRVEHIVIGSAPKPGGQWTEDSTSANWDIGTLSYAEMLSLPGYSFSAHYKQLHGHRMPDLTRPTRREVASYYSAYPSAVNISPAIHSTTYTSRITRTPHGFKLKATRKPFSRSPEIMQITSRHLILATGIFTTNIPPPPIYLPLLSSTHMSKSAPLLVVGSGFTAADVILSQPRHQRILHMYNWTPSRPSPLKGCHPQAYPEYAHIYRRMKAFASNSIPYSSSSSTLSSSPPPSPPPTTSTTTTTPTSWTENYTGLPNAQLLSCTPTGQIQILTAHNELLEFKISGLKYVIGRRGSLEYLDAGLRREVGVVDAGWVSAETMRRRVEGGVEVARDLFVVGSLTGDSLVRFVMGGGVAAAGKILEDWEERMGVAAAASAVRAGAKAARSSCSDSRKEGARVGEKGWGCTVA